LCGFAQRSTRACRFDEEEVANCAWLPSRMRCASRSVGSSVIEHLRPSGLKEPRLVTYTLLISMKACKNEGDGRGGESQGGSRHTDRSVQDCRHPDAPSNSGASTCVSLVQASVYGRQALSRRYVMCSQPHVLSSLHTSPTYQSVMIKDAHTASLPLLSLTSGIHQ
jgi:hypothetical protein